MKALFFFRFCFFFSSVLPVGVFQVVLVVGFYNDLVEFFFNDLVALLCNFAGILTGFWQLLGYFDLIYLN